MNSYDFLKNYTFKMKKGILKKSTKKPSDELGSEVTNMEQRLEELKVFMKAQKEKNNAKPRAKDGSRWRSGTSKMANSNYAEQVLSHKPNPNRKPVATKAKAPKDFLPTDAFFPTDEIMVERGTRPEQQRVQPQTMPVA